MGRRRKSLRVNEILPQAEKIEHKDFSITRALLKKAGDLGLSGVEIPEAYGGLEMDKVTAAVIADHIAKYAGFATTWGGHSGIGTLPIVYFGTEEQKKKYLPKLAAGEMVGAYALSEASSGIGCAQLPHSRRAFARRQALHPERREDVDHQRRLRRSVHSLREDRRREVLGVSGRARLSRDFPSATKSTRWAFADRPPVRSSSTTARCRSRICWVRLAKGHIIAFNILNIGRFKLGAMSRGRRARLARTCGGLCQAAQGVRESDRRFRPGPREDRQHGDADLCRRVDGVSHRRHDG